MKLKLLFGLLSTLAISIPGIALAGLGVSPALITTDNILEGTKITKTFILSRGNPTATNKIKVIISGPAADYITAPADIYLEKGDNQTSYSFTINATGLELFTDYEANFKFFIADEEDVENGVASLFPGVTASLKFTVTDRIIHDNSIKQTIMKSIEEGQQLIFSYFMVNDGNVEAKPSKIELVITDRKNEENIYTETILEENLPSVAPFSAKNIDYFSKAMLSAGQYSVDLTFYDDEDISFSREDLALQVSIPPEPKKTPYLFFGLIGLALIAVTTPLLLLKKKS